MFKTNLQDKTFPDSTNDKKKNTEVYELISKEIPKERIYVDEPMKRHTSFKIGGNADFFVKVNNIDEIKYVMEICNEKNIPLTVVGNGSNLLVKDNGIRGITIKLEFNQLEIEKKDSNKAIVTVGAGILLGQLAFKLLKDSISGFEFAAGIPGTIGGAVRMNAGAYGKEFKDIVVETLCMDESGTIFTLDNKQQKFEYRRSIFKDKKYIILQTKLMLSYVENANEIKEKMDEYKSSRQEKQPLEYPSAGSTFKRGEDFITAKLIDECGLKGYKIGGAEISKKHAGFIINTGDATAKDVLDLVEYTKQNVYDKFGKEIQLEVEVIGE